MFHKKFAIQDKLWFISDLHLNHKGICKGESHWANKSRCRNFETVDEMNSAIINSINNIVAEDHHLFHIGDILFGDKTQIFNIRNKIQCKNIYHLNGNHCDFLRKMQPEDIKQLFKWHGEYLEIFIGKKLVSMFHYPASVFRDSHHGSYFLCGHSHGTFGPSRPDVTTGGKVLDCGWDIHKRPIDFHEVEGIMNKKPIYHPDHHDKYTG